MSVRIYDSKLNISDNALRVRKPSFGVRSIEARALAKASDIAMNSSHENPKFWVESAVFLQGRQHTRSARRLQLRRSDSDRTSEALADRRVRSAFLLSGLYRNKRSLSGIRALSVVVRVAFAKRVVRHTPANGEADATRTTSSVFIGDFRTNIFLECS